MSLPLKFRVSQRYVTLFECEWDIQVLNANGMFKYPMQGIHFINIKFVFSDPLIINIQAVL